MNVLRRRSLSILSQVILATLLVSQACSHAETARPLVVPGEAEAWRFPSGFDPRPLNYSGIYQMDARRVPPMLPHLGLTLTWNALNPADGVYDFSFVERELAKAAEEGYKVIFRLKASIAEANPPEVGQDGRESRTIPFWVVEKHGLGPKHHFLTSDRETNPSGGLKRYASPWHPGVQEEFRRFVMEFGRRGFLERNELAAVYLHGMSISSGEEMDLRYPRYADDANRAAEACGFTGHRHGNPLADAIMDCWPKRMQWWREAAGNRIYKVAFVGTGQMPGRPYPQEELLALSRELGLGQRYGNIEEYYYGNITPPKHGQRYVSPGYVEIDWRHPLRDGRYWGDENEEMNHYRMPGGGQPDPKVRALCYRSSFIRAAQVGMNFLWTNVQFIDAAGTDDGKADANDYVPKWYTQVAGKGPELSPDALCWLRLAWVRVLPGAKDTDQAQPWHNFERLLMQRDVSGSGSVAGAITVPTLAMDFPYVSLKRRNAPNGPPETSDNEYTARRTDLPGNPHIAFKLDPDFRSSLQREGQPVQIRVHFLHDTAAPFTVRVAQAGGQGFIDLGLADAGPPDGIWKTAIFDLPAAYLPTPNRDSTLGEGIDFAVRALGKGSDNNLTIRYVRLNRTAEVAMAPTIRADPITKTVGLGAIARFAVHAEGPGTLRYQWSKGTQTLRDGGRISGSSTDTLVIREVAPGDEGEYRVTVMNDVRGRRETTSQPARLVVEQPIP